MTSGAPPRPAPRLRSLRFSSHQEATLLACPLASLADFLGSLRLESAAQARHDLAKASVRARPAISPRSHRGSLAAQADALHAEARAAAALTPRALRAALGASWAAHRAVAPPEACPWLEPAEILGAPAMA